MSRLALLVWVSALVSAAYPTWETWRPLLGPEQSRIYVCMGGFGSRDASPFLPLRGDLGAVTELATTWAVPALVVLVALGHWQSALAGRRAAGVLASLAFVAPLTPWYSEDDPCGGTLRLFGLEWFETVAGAFGPQELSLVTSALLLLVATHALGPAGEPAAVPPPEPVWHRPLRLLVDYMIVSVPVTLTVSLTGGWSLETDSGLLHWLAFDQVLDEPARLLFFPALVLYILLRRRLAERSAGYRRIRAPVTSARTG